MAITRRHWLAGSVALLGTQLASPVSAVVSQRAPSLPPSGRPPLHVGPQRQLTSLGAAAAIAKDGDTVLVDAGDYRGDVAVWPQNGLRIAGVGGRVNLIADGASAERKAIFVVRGNDVVIEGLSFSGARVRDRNGAGIRHEAGRLVVDRCSFENNENGILTGNSVSMELEISNSSFVDNGAGDGQSHNLYAGSIGNLLVTGSYFGPCRVGHLLKSRARSSVIQYCRLSGEGGTSSYELDLPAGGDALVLGNLIQQGLRSENYTLVSFGAEGYAWPGNTLLMAFNTLVNDRPAGGVFVTVRAGDAKSALLHNLLVGRASMDLRAPGTNVGSLEAPAASFANPAAFDYRLKLRAPQVGAAGTAGALTDRRTQPTRTYVHPASSVELERMSALTPLSPGAFQPLAS